MGTLDLYNKKKQLRTWKTSFVYCRPLLADEGASRTAQTEKRHIQKTLQCAQTPLRCTVLALLLLFTRDNRSKHSQGVMSELAAI